MHTLQLFYVLLKQFFGSLGPLHFLGALLQVFDLSVVWVSAQLIAYRLHLLLQKIFPLLAVYIRTGLAGDLVLQFGQLQLRLQQVHQLLCPRLYIVLLQHGLLILQLGRYIGSHKVHQERLLLYIAQYNARLIRHIQR